MKLDRRSSREARRRHSERKRKWWADNPEAHARRSEEQKRWWAEHKQDRARISQNAADRWTPELKRSSGLLLHGTKSMAVVILSKTAACAHRNIIAATKRLGLPHPGRSSGAHTYSPSHLSKTRGG